MHKQDLTEHPILKQVSKAIALNRSPGYHFCGNFFGLVFSEVHHAHSILELEPASHSTDPDGQMNIAAFAMLIDMGLATGVRADLDGATRLATISMSLQMTGVPRLGRLKASSPAQGFFNGSLGRQGMSQSVVTAGDEVLCYAAGSFMILPPPADIKLSPIRWVDEQPPDDPELDLATLNTDEKWILQHAEQSLAASTRRGDDFISHFLGFRPHPADHSAYCELLNGPHVGNRVGHVQGGITLGLAMTTAAAALSDQWTLTGVSASYVSPGEGHTISARATVIHRGRMTAVVRTEVLSSNGRQVLEVLTNHSRKDNHPVV